MAGTTNSIVTTIQLGIQSCHDLGLEFLATAFGSGPTGQTSLICGVDDDGSLQSKFYLNPFESAGGGPCAGSDWVVIGILLVLVHCVSWLPRWLIWEPIANYRMNGHKGWDETELKRFSTSCAELQSFTLSAFFAFRILISKEWLFQRSEWPERSDLIDADYKFYYLLYVARFCSDSISLFFETRKAEAFLASIFHHVVTIGLVLASASVGHIKYGGIIMFFFDWADIPLMTAKNFKYMSKSPSDVFQWIANRWFEIFAICFFLTRNCWYNYVVYAAWVDLSDDWVNRGCQYMLLLLVILQTYWFWLIIKVAMHSAANGGNADDIRELDAKSIKETKKSQ